MKFEAEVAALQRTPMFQGVDASRLRLLAFMGEDRSFRDGEFVVRQGDMSDNAYLILDGRADVIVEFGGASSTVAQLGDSEVFGEMAILSPGARTATVRALEASVLRRVSESVLRAELASLKPWMGALVRALADRFREREADR